MTTFSFITSSDFMIKASCFQIFILKTKFSLSGQSDLTLKPCIQEIYAMLSKIVMRNKMIMGSVLPDIHAEKQLILYQSRFY